MSVLKKIKIFIACQLIPDKLFIKIQYKRKTGKRLDFSNLKTLNEKIQWLKLFDRTPLHTLCADKFLVRNHVSKKIGDSYLIPLVLATTEPENIELADLPDFPFIIKANHDCGSHIIVIDKHTLNIDEVKVECKRWLKNNYYTYTKEWQYKNIKPMIVIERLLINEDGGIPFDYKVHCINGKAEIISVDMYRGTPNHKRTWFDTNWNRLPISWSSVLKGTETIPSDESIDSPKTLVDMIEKSEILSKDFFYVRIDWYEVDGKLYFGEFTFHHDSGFRQIKPYEWDYKLGQKLKLPIDI